MTIDYVVPMVFHDDVVWRENFRKVGSVYDESNLMNFVRYRSWGTERLLIQLVKKNMPWLRNIIILLAQESQKQEWMDEEGVRVVYHREFIPEKYLPTFNSRGMEMFLKDIPGISDCFLYGNDDMFPLKPLEPTDFFRPAEKGGALLPCIHMTEKPFPSSPNNFQMACREGLNFVAKEFGKRYRVTWLKNGHSIAPILKSTCEHLWERGRQEIEASITAFRLPQNFNQYIYSWWQYFAGEYVDSVPTRKYVNVRKSVEEVVAALYDDEMKIVCVNDHECAGDYRAYASAVRNALKLIVES